MRGREKNEFLKKTDEERLKALDYFVEASRILDKEAFAILLEAVKNNKSDVFEEKCKGLGLNEKMIGQLWAMAKATAKGGPGFPCW